jgi:predicted DNA-binding transcriptional regulator AlpA
MDCTKVGNSTERALPHSGVGMMLSDICDGKKANCGCCSLHGSPAEYLIDTPELCRRLSVGRGWLYHRLREKGPDRIPHIRCGKFIRWRWEDILSWLADQSGAHKRARLIK